MENEQNIRKIPGKCIPKYTQKTRNCLQFAKKLDNIQKKYNHAKKHTTMAWYAFWPNNPKNHNWNENMSSENNCTIFLLFEQTTHKLCKNVYKKVTKIGIISVSSISTQSFHILCFINLKYEINCAKTIFNHFCNV